MKFRNCAAIMAAVLVSGVGKVAAAGAGGPAESLESQVDALFAGFDSTRSPGCALAVIRDERIVYERGYGMADLERGTIIEPHTVFYIASMSKQFTAAAVALLEQQGKISADDDIRKYFPEIRTYGHTIRVHDLIHHTSGLRDYLDLWTLSGRSERDPLSRSRALALIAAQRHLNFEPGERYAYSNSGYFLLAILVERVSGMSLREFMERHFFQPLGMLHTQFYDDSNRVVANRAVGHSVTPEGAVAPVRTSFALVGDGGLLTTVEDLALWDRHFYGNPPTSGGTALLAKQLTLRPLNDGKMNDYAYGLIVSTYRGLPTVEHSGSFLGFNTDLIRFPGQRFSVVTLCNVDSIEPEDLVRKVADLYLARAVTVAAPSLHSGNTHTAPHADNQTQSTVLRLSDYDGRYYSDELDATYEVSPAEGGLSVRAGEQSARKAVQSCGDTFLIEGAGIELGFVRDGRHRVIGLMLKGKRMSGLELVKVRGK